MCDLRIYPLTNDDNITDICSFVDPTCEVSGISASCLLII